MPGKQAKTLSTDHIDDLLFFAERSRHPLRGYAGCRYDKGSVTCAEPDHIDGCPPYTPPSPTQWTAEPDRLQPLLFVRDDR